MGFTGGGILGTLSVSFAVSSPPQPQLLLREGLDAVVLAVDDVGVIVIVLEDVFLITTFLPDILVAKI